MRKLSHAGPAASSDALHLLAPGKELAKCSRRSHSALQWDQRRLERQVCPRSVLTRLRPSILARHHQIRPPAGRADRTHVQALSRRALPTISRWRGDEALQASHPATVQRSAATSSVQRLCRREHRACHSYRAVRWEPLTALMRCDRPAEVVMARLGEANPSRGQQGPASMQFGR
jgi:hypothetical protein